MTRPIIFGTDFDNTVVSYDHLFATHAEKLGIIIPGDNCKKDIRDHLRSLPNGEITWQKLQARVYGPGMTDAVLLAGFEEFVGCCKTENTPVFVVSHKTEFAAQDPETNLRRASINWMDSQGFFNPLRLGLSPRQVFFESTRETKIARIKTLGCTHFVDDMVEVLLHADFPHDVTRILYSPEGYSVDGLRTVTSWREITELLFTLEHIPG
jgi:hypothetical protein